MGTQAEHASTPPTTPPQDPAVEASIGDLVRDATTHLSTVVRGEIELAKLEIGASVRRFGLGAAVFSAAATVLFFSLFFPFIALAEGLVSLGLPRWGAYLVVWGIMLVLTGLLVLLGIRLMKRIQKPERTIETVRDTARLAMNPTGSGAAEGARASDTTGATTDGGVDTPGDGGRPDDPTAADPADSPRR